MSRACPATLCRIASAAADAPSADRELLSAFVASRSELAVAELVRRHGPMVFAACRRVLGHAHDAEDAFQATFLVLTRKAGTIREANLAGWLYAVAVRTARGVRLMRDRRRKHEEAARQLPAAPSPDVPDAELAAIIDDELARLPDHLREAVVLCELQGRSRRDAATDLGIPEGTLSSRLAAARRKLAARLERRGVTAPPAVLAALLAPASQVPAFGTAVPAAAVAAADGVVKAMLFVQLKAVVVATGLLVGVAVGGFTLTGQTRAATTQPDESGELVKQLGSDEFARREAAAKKLRALGTVAEPALRVGLKSDDPEVRQRSTRLLAEVRKDSLDARVQASNPDNAAEPDHPVWRRFKSVAGNDASARALFAELVADPRRLRLLDDVDRNPDSAGDVYRAEVNANYKFVEKLWDRQRGDPKAKHPERPWADEVLIHYLGTYSPTFGPAPKTNVELHAFRTWPDCLSGKCGPAIRRVFAAWLVMRDNTEVVESALGMVGRERVAEAVPFLRALLNAETAETRVRSRAALLLGVLGRPADAALLRRTAEGKGAEKGEGWQVILKGQEKFDSLWADYRLGGKDNRTEKEWSEAWAKAFAEADIRKGDRTLADCAWAAVVRLGGGNTTEMGFHAPLTLKNQKLTDDDWFVELYSHGFTDAATRAAAHGKARAFVAAPAKPQPRDWPTPRGDAANTGTVPDQLPDALAEKWVFKAGGDIDGSPCVAGGVAFVASRDEHLYAVDVPTGKQKWKTQIGTSKASPAVRGESVYVGNDEGVFRRLDFATGKELWRFDTGGEISAAANFHGENVLIASQSGRLYALNAAGRQVWEYTAEQPVHGGVAVVGDVVYLAACDSKVRSIDAKTGKPVGEFDLGGQTGATPAVAGGVVFVGTMANEFLAVDAKTMKKGWAFKPPRGNGFQGSAAVTADAVVIGNDSGFVWALDRKTGLPKWDFAARGDTPGSPVVAGNRVYVACARQKLYVLDLATGKKVQEVEIGGEARGAVGVTGGCVFVATDAGTLHCFGKPE